MPLRALRSDLCTQIAPVRHHRRPQDTASRDPALYIDRPERGALAGGPQRFAASVYVASAMSLSSPLNCHAHQLLSRPCPPVYRCSGGLVTFVIVSTTMNVDVPLWMWPLSRLATIESSFRSNAFLAGRTLKSLYDKVWRALEQTPRRDYWARRRPSKPTVYPFYGSPSWEHYIAPVQSRHRRSPATCYAMLGR